MNEPIDMQPDVSKIIDELLDQNIQLRLQLATLTAIKKQQDEIETKMKESQKISPEAMEMLSKLDIR